MKLRTKANGEVIDVPEDQAEALLDSGLYEPVEESTAVEPLTTEDMPIKKRKVK